MSAALICQLQERHAADSRAGSHFLLSVCVAEVSCACDDCRSLEAVAANSLAVVVDKVGEWR